MPRRRPCATLALLVVLPLAMAGCSTHRTVTQQVTVSTSPLPPGTLAPLVVQPDEAPNGSVALPKATGPADVAMIASFAADPAAAKAALTAHGFIDAYVVEYADLDARTTLVVSVVRFATATGADAQIGADLAARLPAGTTTASVPPVGDRSSVVVGPQPGGAGGQLVTVRFLVGRLEYVVAATAPGAVDPAAVATIGRTLATRAATSPLAT